jgi:uncharacterized RDD family membrane protein YckC
MQNDYRVLTPESVEFVYELAGLGSRMVAALLDHLLIIGILVALWTAMLLVTLFSGGLIAIALGGPMIAVAIVGTFLVYFGYFVYHDVRSNGQTPGKRLMDLRVIDDRGMNMDLFQSLLRNLFRIVDMSPFLLPLDFVAFGLYGVGGMAAFIDRRHKRLGDWAAGTLVVRTRKRVMPDAILAPNEKYNTIQDDGALRSRIRSRLSMEERETLLQLCLRRNELEFEARQGLFAEAASHLEQRLEITRDPFLSQEKFVQNVAAVALSDRPPQARGER